LRIAVLSDTHLREGKSLPHFVWEHIAQVDMILHAGDLTHMGLLEELACIAPVRAVRGNCDGWDVSLPVRDIIECEALRIGLIHGDLGKGKSTPERAYLAFQGTPVDVIVFGHSHTPFMEWRDGIFMFNPGSPTDKRRELQYSFGILEFTQGQLKADHWYF